MAQTAVSETPVPKAGRGLLISGALVLAAGLLLALAAVLGVIRPGMAVAELLGADAVAAPTELVTELKAGDYSVYQRADGTAEELSPRTIAVSGPAGAVVVRGPGTTETLTRGGVEFQSVGRFAIDQAGSYTIRIGGEDPSSVVIGPSLAAVLGRVLPWFVVLSLGVLVALVGVGLLLAGMVRRRRPPAAPAPPPRPLQPSAAPAGWYPDPTRATAAGQRYWDGNTWTDFTA